jgi:hypothetical protein
MQNIKDVVYHVMEGLASKKKGTDTEHPRAWLKKVLTKQELAHIKLNYFKKGVLGVWVDSSSWLYSLNLKKTGVLAGLRRLSKDIQDIRFRIGDTK